jgi:hypothetical protein
VSGGYVVHPGMGSPFRITCGRLFRQILSFEGSCLWRCWDSTQHSRFTQLVPVVAKRTRCNRGTDRSRMFYFAIIFNHDIAFVIAMLALLHECFRQLRDMLGASELSPVMKLLRWIGNHERSIVVMTSWVPYRHKYNLSMKGY